MRKFGAIFKEKQDISEKKREQRILSEFKRIYSSLLEVYNVEEFHKLNEKTQEAFIGEINEYWSEEEGINKKGIDFLKSKTSILTESSTSSQKKNYLKKKIMPLVSETIRQTGLKNRIYSVLDEMYRETKARDIKNVLSPKEINDIILETFGKNLEEFMTEINYELTD